MGVTGLALMLGMMITPIDSNAKGRGMGNGGGQQNGLSTIISNMPVQDLSSLEEIGLTKMREEKNWPGMCIRHSTINGVIGYL